MDRTLVKQAFAKVIGGILVMAALLFIPAWSLKWADGWLMMALLFVPMLVAGLVLMKKNPALLRRRLNAKEEQLTQRRVIAASAVMFVAAFVVAGLNWRFGWIVVPRWVVYVGAALFLAAYAMYAEVLRENEYLSRTVEVSEDQRVVDTGLYGVVRHPMYAATLVLFLSMPLVLGSPVSLVIMLAYPAIIVRRILNEEDVLTRELVGYDAYKKKVKYRLLPGIW